MKKALKNPAVILPTLLVLAVGASFLVGNPAPFILIGMFLLSIAK